MKLRWGRILGAGLAVVPSLARAADVALEAPLTAVCREPGESFEVIGALLEERGHTVTIVAGDEIDTADEIQQFDTVVLSGSGLDTGHDVPVFDAVLPDYIAHGGGLVITGWVYYFNGVDVAPGLDAVAPFEPSMSSLPGGVIELTPGHEIVEGLANWENPSFDAYSGALEPGAIELSRNNDTIDGGVWEIGAGRVASLGPLFTAEYQQYPIVKLHDGSLPDATEMFMRAIEWTANANVAVGCPNGDLDPGEECDDGNDANDDACVNACVLATCGDGYVHAGVEECDDGNVIPDDGCSACQLDSAESSSSDGGESSSSGGGGSTTSEGGGSTTSEGGGSTTSEGGESTTSEGGESTTSEGGESTTSGDSTGSVEGTETGVDSTGDEGEASGSTSDSSTSSETSNGGGGWTGPIDPTMYEGSEAGDDPEAADPTSGCACRADEPARGQGMWWLVAVVASLGARRRRSPAA